MTGTSPGRPRATLLRLLALLAALTVVAAACGSEDEESSTDAGEDADQGEAAEGTDDEGSDAEESGTAFPITISHKYGETTIEAEPERVVSVGFSEQDDLLALGVVPVGIRDWYGDQPFAVWPWAQDALGDAEPEVLSASEINFEQVAALEPDLIVGVTSGMTETEYETLSQIAPTVAQSGDYVDYGVPWQERTLAIGEAVGKADEAAELVEGVEARFAEVREAHPEFEGASAAVAFYFEEQPGAYASSDVRSGVMTDLGFTIPADYDELAGDAFFTSISEEQIDLLDVDVLVWLASTEADMAAITGSPLRGTLNAATEGRELFISEELAGAFSFASALSFEHLLDELVPQLEAAIDGDPATEVPSGGEAAAASGEDGEAASGEASGEEAAAMEAWALVFDSSVAFADKAPHLEDAAALEASNTAYATAGEGMGGISLEPSAAAVDGGSATVTYDVLFAGNAAYEDLTGSVSLVDGVWVVSRDEYCGFLESARTPCQ